VVPRVETIHHFFAERSIIILLLFLFYFIFAGATTVPGSILGLIHGCSQRRGRMRSVDASCPSLQVCRPGTDRKKTGQTAPLPIPSPIDVTPRNTPSLTHCTTTFQGWALGEWRSGAPLSAAVESGRRSHNMLFVSFTFRFSYFCFLLRESRIIFDGERDRIYFDWHLL
jgi:hypothetical protein